MKYIFVGTSSFALPILQSLLKVKEHQLLGIITQPDRCKGRGLKETILPIKECGSKNNCQIYQPENINDVSFVEILKILVPDVIILAAYGQMISTKLLNIPQNGWINIHPSLLPKYRGASPVACAIMNGETITGVTLIKLVRKMDAGPIYTQEPLMIKPDETTPELEKRLSELGARMLLELLPRLESGKAELKEQVTDGVTFAPCFNKEDGLINWSKTSFQIHNHIRAMQPWPGAYTFYLSCTSTNISKVQGSSGDKKVQINIIKSGLIDVEDNTHKPGTIIEASKDKLLINTGKGIIQINELQPSGKRVMNARDFINGYRVKKGDSCGAN